MNLSLKSLKDSLMQTQAAEAISEKAILATHVSIYLIDKICNIENFNSTNFKSELMNTI